MSRCNLSIQLIGDGPFKPGDRVSGFVHVEVDAAVRCRAMHVCLVAKTHGKGNRWKDTAIDEVVFEGEWTPGQELVYPFELTVPDGPVTYHGQILNVSWYVYTYVDIPWGFDPEAEAEIRVVAGEEPVSLGPMAALEPLSADLGTTGSGAVVGIVVAIALFGAVVPMFLIGGSDVIGSLFGGCVAAVFLAIGGLVAFLVLKNRIAERQLGAVAVDTGNRSLRGGESLDVTVSLEPPGPVTLNGATLKLVAKEIVVKGSGTNKTTYTETIHEHAVPLAGAGVLQGATEWKATIRLPDDAPPSFRASSNQLLWAAEVHIDIPRWPDWNKPIPLLVYPRPFRA